MKVRPEVIPSDNELETDIENAMLRDPYIENYEVNVNVNHGVAYLTGKVNTQFEKEQAENIASRVNGVVAIENNLKMEDQNTFTYDGYIGWDNIYPGMYYEVDREYETDRAIKSDIEDQLWWSPYVNEDEVTVAVNDGVARLTGTVDTRREKLYAEVNAYEGGAKEVKNKLDVEYSPGN